MSINKCVSCDFYENYMIDSDIILAFFIGPRT